MLDNRPAKKIVGSDCASSRGFRCGLRWQPRHAWFGGYGDARRGGIFSGWAGFFKSRLGQGDDDVLMSGVCEPLNELLASLRSKSACGTDRVDF
jgi:hypothetical protein